MNKRIDLNDPTAWSEIDWSDPVVPDALKKTDQQVAVSRANRLRIRSDAEKEKSSLSNIKFRQEKPLTNKQKKQIGDAMRGKTLEELIGEERAAVGREARRQSNYKQDYTGRADKMAATRKANGSYVDSGMTGKTHKESTKEIQGKKAKIRQELKRKLGLGKSDSVPKDLLEKEYKKQRLL
jgi:hypothetical protein